MIRPYQTDEEKIQLFMRVMDKIISMEETGLISIRDAFDVLKMNISAMSLDVLLNRNGEKFVDELNTYSSMETFHECFKMTLAWEEDGTWQWEEGGLHNQCPSICIPDTEINQNAHKKDLYITEDMEGFEEVLNRFKTYCEAIAL